MLRSLFSRTTANEKGMKLKFIKEDNSWVVLKGHSILFIGEQDKCKAYMNNFA
jgi:hypothetical protein